MCGAGRRVFLCLLWTALCIGAACGDREPPNADLDLDTGESPCPPGLTDCAGTCVDLQTDKANCGACGHWCSDGSCNNGRCECSCGGVGMTLCNTDPCECADTYANPKHCGTCFNACTGGTVCVQGQCTCPPGLTDFSGTCTATDTDAANCGACGVVCGTGEVCRLGACA